MCQINRKIKQILASYPQKKAYLSSVLVALGWNCQCHTYAQLQRIIREDPELKKEYDYHAFSIQTVVVYDEKEESQEVNREKAIPFYRVNK